MKTRETGLAVRNCQALQIGGVSDLTEIGRLFERSGMFGCNQEGQGMVLAMTCYMRGIDPLEFQQTYHIIEGRPTMRADAMLAKFIERGGTFIIRERTDAGCKATFTKDDNKLEVSYTVEDAKKQGICFKKDGKTLKDNWEKIPKQMCWARLVSDTVRTLDPGVNKGTYTPEEVQDFSGNVETMKNITPAAERPMSAAPISAAKVEPEQPKTSVEKVTPEVLPPDFNMIPVGKNEGKPWSVMTDAQLAHVLTFKHETIKDGHYDAVRAEIDKRKGKANV